MHFESTDIQTSVKKSCTGVQVIKELPEDKVATATCATDDTNELWHYLIIPWSSRLLRVCFKPVSVT